MREEGIVYEQVPCDISLRIEPGSAKCLANWRSVNTTCRECDLSSKIDRLIRPVPVIKYCGKVKTVADLTVSDNYEDDSEEVEEEPTFGKVQDVALEDEDNEQEGAFPVVILSFELPEDQKLLEQLKKNSDDVSEDILALLHYANRKKIK